jgi:hypothetical protein
MYLKSTSHSFNELYNWKINDDLCRDSCEVTEIQEIILITKLSSTYIYSQLFDGAGVEAKVPRKLVPRKLQLYTTNFKITYINFSTSAQ